MLAGVKFSVTRFNAVSAQLGQPLDEGISGSANHVRTFLAPTFWPVSVAISSAACAWVMLYVERMARNSF